MRTFTRFMLLMLISVGGLGLVGARLSTPSAAAWTISSDAPRAAVSPLSPKVTGQAGTFSWALGPVAVGGQESSVSSGGSTGDVAAQVIAVPVRPGSMTITPGLVRVTLRRGPGHTLTADLPQVTIIDARGSLAGWTATVAISASVPTSAELVPAPPVAVTGIQGEVRGGPPVPITPGQAAVLAQAGVGGGGGRFVTTGSIRVPSGRSLSPGTVLELEISIS